MNLTLLLLLILFPAVIGFVLFFVGNDTVRRVVVIAASVLIALAAIYMLAVNFNSQPDYSFAPIEILNKLTIGFGIIIALYFIYVAARAKKFLVILLVLLQAVPVIYFEIVLREEIQVAHTLFFDKFSLIMALIIGIIGTLIAVYALGYMKDFHHHHKEIKDNRKTFFFIIFIFLSAMFGIVFSNSLLWIYFFWEITTLSSFYLIGYTKTEEATKNAFKALLFNLIGGLAFAGAIYYLYFTQKTIEMDKMLALGRLAIVPAALLAFAGMTKSAQMPFSSWLLGAMVAPTPVSALLHSSTMVKAGVYIVLKMAPILKDTYAGTAITFIGALTFLFASLIAISQNNAKRVLAYSTIANLGLIVACGGIGSVQAVWAGILLIIFHAVAKGLLFVTVGTIEHRIGSRDIENMDGLIVRMPTLALFMVIGIAGMFLAPFGMLISKWAVLKAFIDVNPILAVILAFGSAATLFFWSKWMGKLLAVKDFKKKDEEKQVTREEWVSLSTLAIMTVVICGIFPIVSSTLIEPYLVSVFGVAASLSQGNVIIMLIMLGLIVLLPLGIFYFGRNVRYVPPYLSGANVGTGKQYLGSMGTVYDIEVKNYYMDKYFGEAKLFKVAVGITIACLVILFGVLAVWRS